MARCVGDCRGKSSVVSMALVRMREICTPSGIVIDVRCEEEGPQDDVVWSYPVECRTIPSHNFVRVVQAELEARGMVIDSPSFDLAALAIDHIIVEVTGLPMETITGTPLDDRTVIAEAAIFSPITGVMIERRLFPEPATATEVPTTYCFGCGQMVPVADTWTKKADPNYALCEGCFRTAESAGRAKEGL